MKQIWFVKKSLYNTDKYKNIFYETTVFVTVKNIRNICGICRIFTIS